jgi:type II secretory pathway predicted ATPase ExeA
MTLLARSHGFLFHLWRCGKSPFLCTAQALPFLDHLTDDDHRQIIDFLRKVPVDQFGKALAIIQGPLGTGKTYFMGEIIRSILAAALDTQILIATPSNPAADVASVTIHNALTRDALLADKIVLRAHSEVNEKNFMTSYAKKYHREEQLKVAASQAAGFHIKEDDLEIDV